MMPLPAGSGTVPRHRQSHIFMQGVHSTYRWHDAPGTVPPPGKSAGAGRTGPCRRLQVKPEKESMPLRTPALCILMVACLAVLVLPVQADSQGSPSVNVIYQTAFSSDPRWVTNNPSSDYWDPSTGRYHFALEPSTGNYAYTTIDWMSGDYTFEYDVVFDRVDDGATFRFGLTGAEMDFNKGPNVITMFSNGKHENIMSLHLVTTGAKQLEVNSQTDDELTSGTIAYKGATVRFELNTTYHVTVDYDDATRTTTMRVNDKAGGREIWAYYIRTVENIHDMNRIYLGSRGDYGGMNVYASGYIDNVRLTKPAPAVTAVPASVQFSAAPAQASTAATPATTRRTLVTPAPLPADTEETPESPLGLLPAVCALGMTAALVLLRGMKKP